ncbi:beta-1,4-N-acetylgalactosaminyltransferase bre-4-like [Hyalella azteca]|uniref:Beta-1,4-N-acetylgalactosaminyltransferase n=1 Tax=Hyalella azteca TaxID=294128 RepID=A0A8B7PKJ3_HYAAZ|nr:beta-1,4-N-acetylgalactosaminyltransferase bre-4-like [Hyalella azteca]
MTSEQSLTKERNWHRNSEISPRPSSETHGDVSARLEGVKNNGDRTIYTQMTGINAIKNNHSVNNIESLITEGDLVKKSDNKLDNVTGEEPNLSSVSGELLPCPTVPPNLGGPVAVDTSSADLAELERRHPELLPGGQWRPEECQARQKVAIIIPYRMEEKRKGTRQESHIVATSALHLQLPPTMTHIAGAGKREFNRATLMNIGALESVKLYPYDCLVFHDIDLLPEDDRNLYACREQPLHLSVAVDTLGYTLPYESIFGGAGAISVEQFRRVNGFSNKFWGWGGEDDDMANRIKHHGLSISRNPANISRYTMIRHYKDKPNPHRFEMLRSGRSRYASDGLNSLKYRVLDVQLRRLYTCIYVEILNT